MFRNPLVDAFVVLIAVLLIFGPKRLPLIGRGLGQGMREFKDSISGHSAPDEEDEHPALPAATPAATPASHASVYEPAELGSNEPRV